MRNKTIKLGLGVSPLEAIRELAELRWFGNIVRMGEERYPKMAWQARTQGKSPKGGP
jgi:hypothetical protein